MEIKTSREEETYNIGYNVGKEAKKGDIFCLTGDLGVGKTIFTKGFAKAIEINSIITSPTFNIVNSYKGNKVLHHFDLYRIKYIDELDEIGFDEYIFSDSVSLIEWAENVKDSIPKNAVWIKIEKDLNIDENYRKITIDLKKEQ